MILVTVGDSIMEINLVNPKQVCLVMNNLPGAALTSVMMLNQNYACSFLSCHGEGFTDASSVTIFPYQVFSSQEDGRDTVFVSGSLPSESCTVFCICPSTLTSP